MAVFLVVFPRNLAAREWGSADGRYRIIADLSGFNGRSVELSTAEGRNISVSVQELSETDRHFLWTQVSDPKFQSTLPQLLIDFKKSMESTRELEIKRVEVRLKKLKSELRAGSRQMNHPIARQARTLAEQLSSRLTTLQSRKPYLPTLSPKDFRVGQIGTLDDDLIFGATTAGEGDERKISVSFVELRSTLDMEQDVGSRVSWHVSTINRPDLMYIKADFASQLPTSRPGRDPNASINRILHQHVFRIVEQRSRGSAMDYVLIPIEMQDVNPLLLGRQPRPLREVNAANPGNRPNAGPKSTGIDLVFQDVKLRPFLRGKLQMSFTVENVGTVDYFEDTVMKIYLSEDQTVTRGIDKQLVNLRLRLSVPSKQSYTGKVAIPTFRRDPRLRYLLFVINANRRVGENSYDNNTFVLETWK
jgi:hypothetical protein